MRAYYFDNIPGDQRLLHDSGRNVSEATLRSVGVLHWSIPVENWEKEINEVAKERDYKNRDQINVTKEGMGEVRVDHFFEGSDYLNCLRATKRRSKVSLKSKLQMSYNTSP